MNRLLADELGSNMLLPKFERAVTPPKLSFADMTSSSVRVICRGLMEIASLHLDILNEMYGRRADFAGLQQRDDTGRVLDRLDGRMPPEARHPATINYHDMLRGAYVVEQRLALLKAVLDSDTGSGLSTQADLRSPDEAAILHDILTPTGGLHLDRALEATDEAIAALIEHGPLTPDLPASFHATPRNAM